MCRVVQRRTVRRLGFAFVRLLRAQLRARATAQDNPFRQVRIAQPRCIGDRRRSVFHGAWCTGDLGTIGCGTRGTWLRAGAGRGCRSIRWFGIGRFRSQGRQGQQRRRDGQGSRRSKGGKGAGSHFSGLRASQLRRESTARLRYEYTPPSDKSLTPSLELDYTLGARARAQASARWER